MFYGDQDKVVHIPSMHAFYNNLTTPVRACIKYSTMKHELQFESVKLDFFKDMLKFAAARLN